MNPWTSFEIGILNALQIIRSPIFDKIMINITTLGNMSMIRICFIIIFLSTREYNKMAKIMIIAFILNLIVVNLLIKNVVGRIRPYNVIGFKDLLIPSLSDGSFPSGHSSYAFTMATIIFTLSKSKLLRYFTLILAILIAFSRLYLYVHFPTDVLGGAFFGIIIATIAMKLYFSKEYKEFKKKYNLQRL